MKKYCDNCGDMMECSCGLPKTKTPADLKLYSQSDLNRARREGFEAARLVYQTGDYNFGCYDDYARSLKDG